ncbi:MarR family transcriptional regulator [Planotetraspora sp. A-T 1434]|uniref:MarR family winged helix-turn-helix transcriptional regulator n=1 Tax=Planotetraspora sp. A-T 1434 TaxID=2979219 RepID=UPI0021C1FC76|nr:MarR family transcriptional regulator [Planotetraspora sp. A-T 1434]MCT9930745.1 MarR family transcriptional regulator [Planotetraspora sp. A-T 1434]
MDMETGGSPGDLPVAEISAALEQLARLFLRLGSRGDLSLTAAATLASLERSGPWRLTDLAAREGVTQPAMTQLVSRLQEAGLAVRARDPEDGRVVLVHITDTGRAVNTKRRQARMAMLAELLSQLDEAERAGLVAALPAISGLARLVPDERPGTGPTR